MAALDNYTAMADNERRVDMAGAQNALTPHIVDWGIRNALEFANAYQTPRNLLAALTQAAYNAPGTIAGTAQSFLTGQPGGPQTKDEIYNAAGRSVNALGSAGLVAGPFAGRALQGVAATAKPARGITAYHGSPHDFDKFKMSQIGTGEGDQAYGHGLYFAESPEVAKSYQSGLGGWDILKGDKPVRTQIAPTAKNHLQKADGDVNKAIELAKEDIRLGVNELMNERALELLQQVQRGELEARSLGRMYEVNIKANKEDFLDWDRPLSVQSEKIQSALGENVKPSYLSFGGADKWPTQQAAERVAKGYAQGPYKIVEDQDWTGKNVYRIEDGLRVSTYSRDKLITPEIAQQLKQAGIPGIKYLDQRSRGAGEGTYNYVVFDEDLIDITKKMGIGVPMPGGGVSLSEKQMEEVQGAMDFESKMSELESDTWDIY